jgi:hypothetical protein
MHPNVDLEISSMPIQFIGMIRTDNKSEIDSAVAQTV